MVISVAVRQKFHGFDLADQLSYYGVLGKLYTSFYGRIFGKSNSFGYNIGREHISANLISAAITYGFRNNFAYSLDDFFGKWVSSQLGNEDIIVTWGIQALPIIKRAKELGIKVIVERGSAHVIEQRDIIFQEFDLFGIKDNKTRNSFSVKRVDREEIEYELADYISIPSLYVFNSFKKNKIPDSKLFLNPYGVDLSQFKRSPVKHDTFRIINVGRQSIRKGTHYLLRAFKELDLPNSELWLVGEIESDLIPFIKMYKNDNVKFYPSQQKNDLNNFYNMCDVFVICSIQEGMAMVQLQAMACGLPLICTTNTGGQDLIGLDEKAGYVLEIRNINQLKSKIELLYADKELRISMGLEACSRISDKYTWKNYGLRSIQFYNSII
jgi:glycosyltransferase involved in cell wall biosynthesis